ncbi:hypothetical protein LT85_3650 [Collimonas arenae]|uniref:Phage infection protein n=2 Tax=Collimonas arenae TaxID=279058 RepID=A0A0A1FDK4_9BURK|nr:hypothetical protein LT85_3650 [Collimonas arenae]
MRTTKSLSFLLTALVTTLLAVPVFAQSVASETQRDVNQQNRIESGLKSGQLTTREAGQLEHQETKVDRTEANALKNGNLSPVEKARIQGMQNKVSQNINVDKHNGAIGNPNSASSQRMQADVQRNANQEKRIENGIKSGSLDKRQVGNLQRGEAHVDHTEARVARNGHVNANEQARVNRVQNRVSGRIHRDKTNG